MSNKNNDSNFTINDEDLSTRTVRGGFWVFSSRVIEEVLFLIKLVILANILSPKDFGLFGVALLTLDILKIFSQTGFELALIQRKEDIKSYLNSTWTVKIIRDLGLFVIILLIAPAVAFFYNASEATILIQVIGLSLVFGAFTNIGFIYFDKELQFNKRFIYQVFGSLVDFIFSIIIVLIYRNVWAIIIGLLVGNATRCFMSYLLHPYRPRLSSDFGKAKELWGYGKWIFASYLLGFVILEADDMFVGIVLGVTALGFYQLAYKISGLPTTEITNIVHQVTFPAYSKLQDIMPKLRDAYLKVLKFIVFLSFLAGGLILVFAFDFTKVFLGDKWIPMVGAMQILVLWGVLRSMQVTTFSIFRAIGTPSIITKIQVIQIILMAIFIYPLTMKYDISGTSMAIVFSALVATFLCFYKVTRIIECKRWNFWKIILLPLINIVIVISSILILKIYLIKTIGLIELGILVAFALMLYIAITFIFEKLFDYKIIKEGFAIYRQLVMRKL